MESDMWAKLLWDLLVEIFRRLGSTAVIRCAGVRLYDAPLSPPRDGFRLLRGRAVPDLCLCNPLTGSCRFLPAAEFGAASSQSSCIMYVLATCYDDSPSDGSSESAGVWMLAAETARDLSGGMTYRVFSFTSGMWGPIKRSAKLWNDDQQRKAYMSNQPKDVVICRRNVYWLVLSIPVDYLGGQRWCAFAMDMRTERTWIIELPMKTAIDTSKLMLAASEDGRLSLITSMLVIHQINVWVLTGENRWMLLWEIEAQNWLPAACCPKVVSLRAFCPRSGFMLVCVDGQELLVSVCRNSPQEKATTRIVDDGKVVNAVRYPFEMDWSSYISKMKYL